MRAILNAEGSASRVAVGACGGRRLYYRWRRDACEAPREAEREQKRRAEQRTPPLRIKVRLIVK